MQAFTDVLIPLKVFYFLFPSYSFSFPSMVHFISYCFHLFSFVACNGLTANSGTFILNGVEVRNNQGKAEKKREERDIMKRNRMGINMFLL